MRLVDAKLSGSVKRETWNNNYAIVRETEMKIILVNILEHSKKNRSILRHFGLRLIRLIT